MKELKKRMESPIRLSQVDNGMEFASGGDKTSKESASEKVAKEQNMQIRWTRLCSPWQNGKVERNHREDGKILYGRKIFTSEKELKRQVEKHDRRYHKTAKTSLNYKSPDKVVAEYFSKCNICLDN